MDLDKNCYVKYLLISYTPEGKKAVFTGSATVVLGAASAVALFQLGMIAVESMLIIISVATIAVSALAVGDITYMILSRLSELCIERMNDNKLSLS